MVQNDSKKSEPKKKTPRFPELLAELRALSSCLRGDIRTFFDRLASQTMPMIRKEKALKPFLDDAETYFEDIRRKKRAVLVQLQKLRKEFDLDQKIPVPKACATKDLFSIEFFNDERLQIILVWLFFPCREVEDLTPKEKELYTALCCWRELQLRAYPIGESPEISIALLLSSISQYAALKRLEKLGLHQCSTIFSTDYAKKLREDAQLAVGNLVQEFSLFGLWEKYPCQARRWRKKAKLLAQEWWACDKTISIRKMAPRVYEELKNLGYEGKERTVREYIRDEWPNVDGTKK